MPLTFKIPNSTSMSAYERGRSLLQGYDVWDHLVLPKKQRRLEVSPTVQCEKPLFLSIIMSCCSYPTRWPTSLLFKTKSCNWKDQMNYKWSSSDIKKSSQLHTCSHILHCISYLLLLIGGLYLQVEFKYCLQKMNIF